MYISLNATLTANQVAWPDFAKLAASTGYNAVDVNLSKAMEAGVDATRSLLSGLKLKPAIAGLPVEYKKEQSDFDRDMAKLEDASRFAAAIGCPRMGTWILSSSPTPKAELRKLYRERLGAACRIMAKHGVKLSVEFIGPLHLRKQYPHEFIYRMDEMLEFVKEVAPNAGLMLDSWHWHHAGGTAKDIVDAGRDRIVHVQVADAPKLPPDQIRDGERLMPGEGILDFNAFFGALKQIGYDGAVSPEIFGRGLKDMAPEEGAKLGFRTTFAMFNKAGVPFTRV